ncbi:AtpZ/AtpI family protein [Sulfitobacter pseudonitzschiae]|nr:AtpZ/AtpI family protein [Pseudosulfitobacter pseudonitzschiae]MBM1833170.1 AtpZ/AtpI family protein [Pseudosulfitobacter pseudonitzschiae]MBM1838038.1 AtpZ/AtpI family protein [Pseudosulfitobacter pseudonitzschiae]MBM1843299.1 AtpZ/AtpI family protein [Pseudosulfitobacter pseudonitzschiae]MBM1848165.1 AtpZ/AtpI family protein [Pseudosulfitobacter pseudonitzschiae]
MISFRRTPPLTQNPHHRSYPLKFPSGGHRVAGPEEQQRMRDLEAKIKALKGEDKPEAHHYDDHHSQAQMAWRMVIELVTGLGIGFGIGYGLDSLLGTKPWLMILFILLGFAAGVNVMIRSAREMQRDGMAKAADSDDAPRGTDEGP